MIPGNANPLLLASAAADAAAAGPIKSVRFNDDDSAYLNFTPSSAGNRQKWTWAGWVKRSGSGANKALFGTDVSNNTVQLVYNSSDNLRFQVVVSGTSTFIDTDAVFRDFSGWYHVTLVFDSAQATAANRTKIYVNGAEQSVTGSFCAQNTDGIWNSANAMNIGQTGESSYEYYFDGYLADVYFIDGSALDPTSFGAYDDNGVWQSASYSGTFGTNGFHLFDFASESGIGSDSSGNDNDFTVNNLQADGLFVNQGFTSPGNAFDGNTGTYAEVTTSAALGQFVFPGGISVSSSVKIKYSSGTSGNVYLNGSATALAGTGAQEHNISFSGTLNTIGIQSSSKPVIYYVDIDNNGTYLTGGAAEDQDVLFDVPTNGTQSDTGAGGEVSGNYPTWNPLDKNTNITLSNGNLDAAETSGANHFAGRATFKYPATGKWYYEATITTLGNACCIGVDNSGLANPSLSNSGVFLILVNSSNNVQRYLGSSFTSFDNEYGNPSVGSVLQVAYDADADKLWLGMNNVWMGSGSSANGNPGAGTEATASNVSDPFPSVNLVTSALSVNFGQRSFSYAAPTNFKPLCTTLLPTPTIADGSEYFDVKTYTGTGTTNAITGFEFSPDFVWLKARDAAYFHRAYDTVRGATKELYPDDGAAQNTTTDGLTSFDSSGFTLGGNAGINQSTKSYVAWAWNAGSSTVSNTDGDITSSVRASQASGFSIVQFEGSGTAGDSVGHGLSNAPELIFFKNIDNSTGYSWRTFTTAIDGSLDRLFLNGTNEKADQTGASVPDNSVFYVASNLDHNSLNDTIIAYCFTSVDQYSRIGVYTGNQSTDGTFVYTGFKPAFVILKHTQTTGYDWAINDAARNTHNPASNALFPSSTAIEDSTRHVDLLSNGFKLRNSSPIYNQSNVVYLYMAFASHPFQANGGLAR